MWVCGLPWKSTADFEDKEDAAEDHPKVAFGFDDLPEGIIDAANHHNSGGRNIGWVNYMVRVMWPNIREVMKKKVVEAVTERAKVELKMAGISVKDLQVVFDPGDTTPRFLEIRTYEVEEDGISGLQLDVDLLWTTDDSFKIQPLFEGSMGSMMLPSFKDVQVTHIRFEGTVSFVLAPLVETPPCFGAVQVFFFDPPELDMTIKAPIGVLAETVIGEKLADIMRSTALNVMKDSFILPQRMMVKVVKDLAFDELVKIHSPLPKGLLEIEVRKGRDLIASDTHFLKARSSDPFVVISLGDAKMRTSTVASTLNPEWQDGPDYLLVYNWNQMVQIELFDADRFTADDPIGCVPGYTVYHLCTEAENKPEGHWFDIMMKEKMGGQLLLRVRYLNLATLKHQAAVSLARKMRRRDSMRSNCSAYNEDLPHLVTVKLLGLEVDSPSLLTEARATVRWEDADSEHATPSQASLPGGAMPQRHIGSSCSPRVLRQSLREFQKFTSHAAGAAANLIAFKGRDWGVPKVRTSGKAKDWREQMERVSTRKRGAVPVNVARAIAQLRDRDKFPLERIADMFGLDLAATEAAANLRANFGVAWHQAFHFLQGAGEQPGAGSVTIDVRCADRVAKAHPEKSGRLRNKEGLVGTVRADFRPEQFAATKQSQTLVCHVRAPLRRKDLDEEQQGDDSDGEYFVNEELCGKEGTPVPSAVIEFSVELRSLTSGSCVGRLPGGQEPTLKSKLVGRAKSRAVSIRIPRVGD